MLAQVFAIVLAGASAESLAIAPLPEARSVRGPKPMVFPHSAVTTQGNAVASTTIPLERWVESSSDAYSVSMSLGPLINEGPDTTSFQLGGVRVRFDDRLLRRLRVRIGTCERSLWMVIDDIRIGRADSRWVVGSYRIDPYDDVQDLWTALRNAPRVLGSAPEGPAIRWLSPTSFVWVGSADTLVIEQKRDSIFTFTAKARVR